VRHRFGCLLPNDLLLLRERLCDPIWSTFENASYRDRLLRRRYHGWLACSLPCSRRWRIAFGHDCSFSMNEYTDAGPDSFEDEDDRNRQEGEPHDANEQEVCSAATG